MFNKVQKLEFCIDILERKKKAAESKLKEYEWKKNFDITLSTIHFNRVCKKIDNLTDIIDSYEYSLIILNDQMSGLKKGWLK